MDHEQEQIKGEQKEELELEVIRHHLTFLLQQIHKLHGLLDHSYEFEKIATNKNLCVMT